MATEFITNLPADDHVLTSRLNTISARTDKTKVEATVIRDPDGEADVFFKTTLYAFEGVVELSAVGKLIEERFRAKGCISDMISVVIDGVSLDFNVLYCTFDLNTNFDCKKCFWTTSRTAVVHRRSAICLAHYNRGSRIYGIKVVGLDSDNRVKMVTREFTRVAEAQCVSFAVDDILIFALEGSDLVKVSYFSIEYGDIQKMFYVVDDPEYLTFRFLNMFNAPEYVDVVGKVTRKTVADRDTAICSGRSRHYNQVINRTYEVETGALTAEQAQTIEQLICSYDVELCGGADDYRIIITDHSCEVDNDDDSLVTMKFTFRLVGDRPALLDAEMDALAPGVSHIFSHEFTAEFA